jgi:hypothetical protein
MNRAVWYAEIMLEHQLSEPTFISQLEQACRDYEIDVYQTDEATTWGWQQYRPELPGERRSVRLIISHAHGLLITNGAQLRLFSNGNEVVPSDGVRLQLVSYEQRTLDLIRRWNEMARAVERESCGVARESSCTEVNT